MKYKCDETLFIPKCDADGFEIANKYGSVMPGSVWLEDNTSSICGGEIHLECISGCNDFGWIEVSRETLAEAFLPVEN